MVVDTSALLAIAYREPEQERLREAVDRDGIRLISAASMVEAAIVVARRTDPVELERAFGALDRLVAELGLRVEAVTPRQAIFARDAYARYGKGLHRAGLNYGDCFSYALAKESGEPLLFKGDDFPLTDVTPAG